MGGGQFFSPDKDVAQAYAGEGGSVIQEDLTFSKPLKAKNWAEAKKDIGLDSSASMEQLITAATEKGYDGIVFEAHNGKPEYVKLNGDTTPASNMGGDIPAPEIIKDKQGFTYEVWHGSKSEFEKFDESKKGSNSVSANAKEGFFFSSDKEIADSYAESYGSMFTDEESILNKKLTDQYMELSRRANKGEDVASEIEAKGKERDDLFNKAESRRVVGAKKYKVTMSNPYIVKDFSAEESFGKGGALLPKGSYDPDRVMQIIQTAKDNGHDGVVINNIRDSAWNDEGPLATTYIAFNPDSIENLQASITQLEGSPPPAKESIPAPRMSVELAGPSAPMMSFDDGGSIVRSSEGDLHYQTKDGKVLQTFKALKFVTPEVQAQLAKLTNNESSSPDGAAITLSVNKKGELVINSLNAIREDLTVDPNQKQPSQRVIKTEETSDGNGAVFVSERTTQGKVNQDPFFVAPGKVSDSAGAMKIGEGQKVSKYVQKLIEKAGPDRALELKLVTEQFEDNPDNTRTSKIIPLRTYYPKDVREGASVARQTIQEKGPYEVMDYLANLDRFNQEDQALANAIIEHWKATEEAIPLEDFKNRVAATDMLSEAYDINEKPGNVFGGGLQLRTEAAIEAAAGRTVGDTRVRQVKTKLEQKAYEEFKKETGEDTTIYDVSREVEAADNQVAEIEAEIEKVTKPRKPRGKAKEGEAAEESIPVPPELDAQLTKAKENRTNKKDKLTKIIKKLEEVNAAFTPEDQANLKNWSNLIAQAEKGTTNYQKLAQALVGLESKYIQDGDDTKIDYLFNFWRRNTLSGWATQLNNAIGNIASFAGTAAGIAATGQNPMPFLRGGARGLGLGWKEAGLIVRGERAGRLSLGEDGNFKPESLQKVKVGGVDVPWNPFNIINEMASRFLSAADSISVRTNREAQLEFASTVLAKKAGVPKDKRLAWADNKLYRTEKNLEEITADTDAQIAALATAGIKTSPSERELMIYEQMQIKQDEVLRAVADRHSVVSTYLNDPEWALGKGYDILNYAIEELSFNFAGGRVKPLKMVLPFIRTGANVANDMLNYTIVGAGRAAYTKFKDPNIPLEGGKRQGSTKEQFLTSSDAPVDNSIEARQLLGKAIVGTTLTGLFTAWGMAVADDEDPWITFFGDTDDDKEYSIRVGGSGGSYIKLGNTPLAILPVIASAVVDGYKQGKDTDMIIANAVMGSMGAMTDLSFIKSISDLADLFKDVGRGITDEGISVSASLENQGWQQGANVASGFIPSVGFLRNLGKWINGSPVETYNNFRAKMIGNLPFGPEVTGAEYKLNIFGEPIEYDVMNKAGLGRFLADSSTDPVALWMTETGYEITRPGHAIKLNKTESEELGGYTNILTPEESRRVLELSGPPIKAMLDSIRQTPEYSVFNEERQKLIHREVSKIRSAAKLQARKESEAKKAK